jgi:ectoine hydroxylase-related dioxygenase (phytanoyl-CoA dioxygenase family)
MPDEPVTARLADAVVRDGFAICPGVVAAAGIGALIAAVSQASFARSARGGEVYGARNILADPDIGALAHSAPLLSLVQACIGPGCRPVRGIFFDKTPGANWPVAWHQDLTLAVAERREVPGWTNWSVKAGVHHVQPPADVLERMVTLRIQLDDSGADNGPLRVLPGTHRLGRIKADRLPALRREIAEATCLAPAGSALVFKPLLLHASSAAKEPKHRRVIHLEFAPETLLPPELRWL